jgi:hypothetical protein
MLDREPERHLSNAAGRLPSADHYFTFPSMSLRLLW